ncbi:MAG TPA: hypothetical protein VHC90_20305 [Bryobacteraceae bacterium]|nr:hypothetical protein [Bryobacteraceae bacterium]
MMNHIRDQSERSPSSEDLQEVYARFGLAYYMAEVLHRGLCNLYCAFQLPPNGPVLNSRVEEHLRVAFEMTLGQLLRHMKPVLVPELFDQLGIALRRRNFIAHHFWYERVHLMARVSGIEAMIAELSEDTELFRELDGKIQTIIAPYHERSGLTPEIIAAELDAIRSGMSEGPDPLPERRVPRKQETIVHVYEVPATSGHSNIIFETDDGSLWQLCDGGLGWAPHDRVEQSWRRLEKFEKLLPARINPRPTAPAPWQFEIPFGETATLAVCLGKKTGQVIYDLRLPDDPSAKC